MCGELVKSISEVLLRRADSFQRESKTAIGVGGMADAQCMWLNRSLCKMRSCEETITSNSGMLVVKILDVNLMDG